jgi:subtilisin family serine protease
MISCNFTNQDKKAEFIAATGIIGNSDGSVTVPLSLIPLAKSFEATLTQVDSEIRRLLIKTTDLSKIKTPHSLVTDQGNGGQFTAGSQTYYLVETANYLNLYNELMGEVEQVDVPVKLLSVIDAEEQQSTPADLQWPRLRMISRSRPLLTTFTLAETTFARKPNVVVIDSGINFNHSEFAGLETEDLYALPHFNGTYTDTSGHGTAVAGAVAGSSVGVHRHLRLLNCKVFDVNYKPNAIELGYALDACYAKFMQDPTVPMVVNCSWTVAKNSYLEGKFQDLLSAGITVVAAAGNSGIDVEFLTPAGMANVITVAASDKDDVGAGFNNFSQAAFAITTNVGLSVDIFAPGVDVYVPMFSSTSNFAKMSGSSVSAGFVSGAIAATLSVIPGSYEDTAKTSLLTYANKGVLLLDPDKFTAEQNRLVYLITSENQTAFETSAFYLGALTQDMPSVTSSISTVLDVHNYSASTSEQFTYSTVWKDTANSAVLNGAFQINNEGFFTLTNPSLTWQPDEKIRLVSFKIIATGDSGAIKFTTPELIFFATNPTVVESLEGDIVTALENVDNQSFFAAWVANRIK